MEPYYTVTSTISQLTDSISGKVQSINPDLLQPLPMQLRRQYHSSSGSLTKTNALEATNARKAYGQLAHFAIFSGSSFCHAHQLLMHELMHDAGAYRTDIVRVRSAGKTIYLAPAPAAVPALMDELFAYLRDSPEHAVIKSCVFHYEILRIHPFIDGNGRVARLWQTLILQREHPVYALLPVETLVGPTARDYYRTLALSDAEGNPAAFIAYLLGIIDAALTDLLQQNASF